MLKKFLAKFFLKDVRAKSAVQFTWWPRLLVTYHRSDISIQSVAASYTGFGNAATDQQVSAVISNGAPGWIANNQDFINREIQKVVFGYVNTILQKSSSLDQFVLALLTYNPAVGC